MLKKHYYDFQTKQLYHILNKIKRSFEDVFVNKIQVNQQIITNKQEIDNYLSESCKNLYSTGDKII